MQPVIVHSDMVTPYGYGKAVCWDSIMEGRSAIGDAGKFAREEFISRSAALVPELEERERSRVLNILMPLLSGAKPLVPRDSALLLATTTGEIDLLERSVLGNSPRTFKQANLRNMLNMVKDYLGLHGPASVISAACASSTAAIARAADMISTGQNDSVLVIGCDALSEFVFAGFSTLMALSPDRARPFDRKRDGLTLGEAAAITLMMDRERAQKEARESQAQIMGWGMASDAHHMTGPSRDGSGLAQAVMKALKRAGIGPANVTSISAHGTGTVYNDAMEMEAFRSVFGEKCVPLSSIKGGTGHTMGCAGILEALISTLSIQDNVVPPTIGTDEPEDDALDWISAQSREIKDNRVVLTTNSGFGGVNGAIVVGRAL